jgi:hypothetical protein
MSKIEVNAVEPQSGTTLTLGASGDTVALAAGASQTGFGRQGTVNWSSTIRTSGFTAVSGVGYYCDTSSAAFTVILPANPSVGDIVAIKDWSSTAATNNIGIGRNGQKIEGNTSNGAINVHGDAQTLVFSGTSRGWMVVGSGLLEGIQVPEFIAATGGTVTFCGNCKVHTFTSSGCFVVTNGGNDLGSNSVNYLVVAGGGAGGNNLSGGGGGGGFRKNFPSPAIAGLPVVATTYPITVGAGGSVRSASPIEGVGGSGSDSIFSTITSAGGGGGGGGGSSYASGNGGSGGGAPGYAPAPTAGGTGNTPPVSPSQGNPGGAGGGGAPNYPAGGGGGSAAAGGRNPGSSSGGSAGGAGTQVNIDANNYYWAGGGGGGKYTAAGNGGSGGIGGGGGGGGCSPGSGGTGGGSAINSGANGQIGPPTGPGPSVQGGAGGANSGGGGGGSGHATGLGIGGAGGSGIVVIRYKYQ